MTTKSSPENTINDLVKRFGEKLPRFQDGRIDYTGSAEAPVVNIIVKLEERILILKRGSKVANYKGMWNGVAGFIDEPVPIKEKVLEELLEETGITDDDIERIVVKRPYRLVDADLDKVWHVCPVLVEVKPGCRVVLDWEHTEYKWITPEEIQSYKTVMGFNRTVKAVLRSDN